MTAAEYNARETAAERLRREHLLALGVIGGVDGALESAVRAFQAAHGLTADGKAGPKTRAAIDAELSPRRVWPLRGYRGRAPIVTSGYGPRARRGKPGAFHHGLDLGLAWLESDPEERVYSYRYRSGPHRGERWVWTPPECRVVIASAPGVVRLIRRAANGHQIWIDHRAHGIDLCTGYLHLATPEVAEGQEVAECQDLAAIWSRIEDPHLHYEELDEIRPYRPRRPDLSRARVIYAE